MLNFIRMTILGGLLFLLPFAVLAALVGKLISTARPIIEPVSQKLPLNAFAGFSATILITVIFLIAVSFVAGFFAKTQLARHLVRELETYVLNRVPAYSVIKSVSEDFVAQEEKAEHPVVLVNFDDSRQLGIKTGKTDDGQFTIVFMPDSPTPQTGTVLIMESGRVQETDIPLRKAFSSLTGRGVGLEKYLSNSSIVGELPR